MFKNNYVSNLLTLATCRVMKKAKYISRDMLEPPANERRPVYEPHIYIYDVTGRKYNLNGVTPNYSYKRLDK